MVLVGVFDSKAAAFVSFYVDKTEATAIRAFQDAVIEEGSQFGAHAADYSLFRLGGVDPATGDVAPECGRRELANGSMFVDWSAAAREVPLGEAVETTVDDLREAFRVGNGGAR